MDILINAVVYDLECFPNTFTYFWEFLNAPQGMLYEVSEFQDDRHALFAWFDHLSRTRTPMIGFNSVGFDYPVLHWFRHNPTATVAQVYDHAQRIITSNDRFAHTIWESDRLVPQIDLYKIHHFDNPAKSTSLKALQVNMRSKSVVESAVPFGTVLTREQVLNDIIPYNQHDVRETKRFAHYSMAAIRFREGLIPQFGLDVLNYNDTKIGAKILESRLGYDQCYWRDPFGRRHLRQTPRTRIALADIILPVVQFQHPEFQRVLRYMRDQVLTPEDIDDPEAPIKTKGVFKGLTATVGGVIFHFGTGGVHGSVSNRRYVAGDGWRIRDIDVASLYPSVAITNSLAPEHLGAAWVVEYRKLPEERSLYPKGTVENAGLKLAANGGGFGMTNNKYSSFYDPQYTMTITINGQLLLCMLIEWIVNVPTIELIQANTDGITYKIHEQYEPQVAALVRLWESLTGLVMESVDYKSIHITDVNTYLAVDMKSKVKQKGRLWHPDPDNYAQSISEASPPKWHTDLSNIASVRAAVQSLLTGCDPGAWLRAHTDAFDFMLRTRANRGAHLLWGDEEVQRTFRYYVARDGRPLVKVDPPAGPPGAFKRAPRITEVEYQRVMRETGGAWDARVCTANRSVYEERRTAIQAGYLVAPCNRAADFDWARLDYDWYEAEARKLLTCSS